MRWRVGTPSIAQRPNPPHPSSEILGPEPKLERKFSVFDPGTKNHKFSAVWWTSFPLPEPGREAPTVEATRAMRQALSVF